MARAILTPEERFFSLIEPEPMSGCWLWCGAIASHGYGTLLVRGRGCVTAHRFSWEIHFGPIPDGLQVMHKCDLRACVNPDHLMIGTRQQNQSDMAMKNRGRKSSKGLPYGVMCPRGHKRKKPFCANVRFRDRVHYLGYFATSEEASAVAVAFRSSLIASMESV